MKWMLLLQLIYILLLIVTILRALYDTRSSTKALAYILFIIFVPLVGMIFYFSFGINYRKRKLYSKKLVKNKDLRTKLLQHFATDSQAIIDNDSFFAAHQRLAGLLLRAGNSPLTATNEIKLLINGEEKFPELLRALDTAKNHIHLEYYIYEGDVTGNAIANKLIEKAKQGVVIRFMYDDFGSHSLSKSFIKRLNDSGIQTVPFYKIKLFALAGRLNYRNHRKIIIIDGITSFVGGINVSDRYRNDLPDQQHLFWRDTHLKIKGNATAYLQYIFLCDWNFANHDTLKITPNYFPEMENPKSYGDTIIQIAASGPDSNIPLIFYSLLKAIGIAKKQILITSPYFIPGESLMDALIIAAESGVSVQLLVPKKSDSKLVNAAAYSYYTELLRHGIEIYQYKKGFVHAKTMVIDDTLTIIGSANMDYRSFDLNFEVNAMVYDKKLTAQLNSVFLDDIKNAKFIDANQWLNRPTYIRLWEKLVRLLSPFL